jgi:hypothetical protein
MLGVDYINRDICVSEQMWIFFRTFSYPYLTD